MVESSDMGLKPNVTMVGKGNHGYQSKAREIVATPMDFEIELETKDAPNIDTPVHKKLLSLTESRNG